MLADQYRYQKVSSEVEIELKEVRNNLFNRIRLRKTLSYIQFIIRWCFLGN